MKHRLLYIPILLLFMLSFVDCAKKGTPTGGKMDSIPPVILKTTPENYSTNFSGDEIRIYFDEYIKLKELQQNLIISPPMKYAPTITPLSTAKYIKIKLQDTLLENTTYSINFGQSIVDNNEENPYQYYKYVFSTGSYIDSLKLSGTVRDGTLLQAEPPVTVMLYPVDETFKDSIIYSEKPMYVTTTKDSTNTFELTNLKEGNYVLLALKESSNDYIYQPKKDKIGFANEMITLPTDSSYTLTIFKEQPSYKIARPKHESKYHIQFGFEGDAKDLKLDLLSNVPSNFEYKTYFDQKKDTLHYWFKPEMETDSLQFIAKNYNQIDTLTVRLRNLFKDSLRLTLQNKGTLVPHDTVTLIANTPLSSLNSEKIQVISKDSTQIEISAKINEVNNLAEIFFQKKEDEQYSVNLLPGALTDFYETQNDTLQYNFRTKNVSDYGTLSLKINNRIDRNLIVQLVDDKFNLIAEKLIDELDDNVFFDYINPGLFYVRVIFDENGNGVWDTGNFLERKQPERVVYYPSQLEVRANWSLQEQFTLN